MTHINMMELQNLRELIGAHDTAAKKLEAYAQSCSDPEFKQMFQQSAQSARNTKQKLASFLQ
ncbi:MAG: hypothetical protein GXX09_03535 [Syntrophomonadaceae bacterium]|nr:hypothetical protein [Syntrophomonadaceae bacterium]